MDFRVLEAIEHKERNGNPSIAAAVASINEPTLIQTQRKKARRSAVNHIELWAWGSPKRLEQYVGITKESLQNLPKFGANSATVLMGEILMDSFHELDHTSKSLAQKEGRKKALKMESTKVPSLHVLFRTPKSSQALDSEAPQISKTTNWYSTKTEGVHFDYHIKQEGERGEEWLQLSTSDDISTEVPGSDDDILPKENSNMSRSDKMMKEVALYFKILKWTGRMPFAQKKCHTFTKFYVNLACWNCRIYFATSIFMTVMGIGMLTNFIEIVNQPATSIYRKVEELEFDNYWIFGLFVMFYLWQVAVTSLVMIFQGSFHTGEFLTRWNICIDLLGYDTSTELKSITRRGLIGITVYALILICAMLVDGPFMDWNNCFGFISTLVLRDFIPKLRISKHYGWLRWLGLFVHLYTLFASRLTTQMLILYCRALETGARLYNIRLLGVLGTTSRRLKKTEGKRSTVVFKRVIPYKKLFMEHRVLTTFSRQIGRVFAVRFLTSVLMQWLIVFLTVFNVALILQGYYSSKKFKTTEIPGLQNVAIPIKYQMSLGTQGFILAVLAGFSSGSFLYTSQSLHHAGEELMKTADHIRRFSFLQCVSSMERRFILTMQNCFNPKTDFYINCGFVINRQFIFAVTTILASTSIMLCDFSIQRLLSEEIVFCNDAGQCRKAVFNPATPGVAYPERGKMLYAPNSSTIPIETPLASETSTQKRSKFEEDYMFECPGINGGTISLLRKIFYLYGDGDKVVYHSIAAQDLRKKDVWCEQDGRPFSINIAEKLALDEVNKLEAGNDTNWKHLCYRRVPSLTDNEYDDCGNRAVRLPNKITGESVWPYSKLTKITLNSKDLYYCCWTWEGYDTQCGLTKRTADTSLKAQKSYVKSICNPGGYPVEQLPLNITVLLLRSSYFSTTPFILGYFIPFSYY
ncbi:hypothetical protein Ocin01_07650 [Orchesella cincta]|uniref:Uncharacterized protein n=1 Tax=Orchesella cincta TaxID=48709 RepID=A0A1D2N1U7_ORCCI|nr:hypothetical protein Ocin01_07650 [Orchesella cincta]